MIKIDEIEKYNKRVSDKFPGSQMRKVSAAKIIWVNNGERVASLENDLFGFDDKLSHLIRKNGG